MSDNIDAIVGVIDDKVERAKDIAKKETKVLSILGNAFKPDWRHKLQTSTKYTDDLNEIIKDFNNGYKGGESTYDSYNREALSAEALSAESSSSVEELIGITKTAIQSVITRKDKDALVRQLAIVLEERPETQILIKNIVKARQNLGEKHRGAHPLLSNDLLQSQLQLIRKVTGNVDEMNILVHALDNEQVSKSLETLSLAQRMDAVKQFDTLLNKAMPSPNSVELSVNDKSKLRQELLRSGGDYQNFMEKSWNPAFAKDYPTMHKILATQAEYKEAFSELDKSRARELAHDVQTKYNSDIKKRNEAESNLRDAFYTGLNNKTKLFKFGASFATFGALNAAAFAMYVPIYQEILNLYDKAKEFVPEIPARNVLVGTQVVTMPKTPEEVIKPGHEGVFSDLNDGVQIIVVMVAISIVVGAAVAALMVYDKLDKERKEHSNVDSWNEKIDQNPLSNITNKTPEYNNGKHTGKQVLYNAIVEPRVI